MQNRAESYGMILHLIYARIQMTPCTILIYMSLQSITDLLTCSFKFTLLQRILGQVQGLLEIPYTARRNLIKTARQAHSRLLVTAVVVVVIVAVVVAVATLIVQLDMI